MQESQHPLPSGFPHSAQEAAQGSHAETEAAGDESTMDSGTLSVGAELESANARLVNKPEIVSAIPVKNDIVFMIKTVYR
jgi:hypothetical protein